MKNFKNLLFSKKGELTTRQIVLLIILIASFSIILIFLSNLNLGETSDKEICRNSVIMKSKGGSLSQGSLDCKTIYICISGGDKCESFLPTITKEIDLNQEEEKIKKDVIKAIAEEMADCWWMFGEGKVEYADSPQFLGETHCGICSEIKFDKKIQEKIKEISYKEFYESLTKLKKDDSQTYSEYLYRKSTLDGLKETGIARDISVVPFIPDDVKNLIKRDIENNFKVDTNKKHVIITGEANIDSNNLGGRENPKIYPYFLSAEQLDKDNKNIDYCDVFDLTKA